MEKKTKSKSTRKSSPPPPKAEYSAKLLIEHLRKKSWDPQAVADELQISVEAVIAAIDRSEISATNYVIWQACDRHIQGQVIRMRQKALDVVEDILDSPCAEKDRLAASKIALDYWEVYGEHSHLPAMEERLKACFKQLEST